MPDAQSPHPPLGELIDGVAFEDYVRAPGINATGLKHILRSPAHYQASLTAEDKDTPALKMGRLLHMAVLEPERLSQVLTVAPSCDRRTKAGRDAYAEFLAGQPTGAEVVSATDYARLGRMLDACQSHSRLRGLLASGRREASLWWQDPVHGVLCKGRFDFVAEKTRCIVDIKSTQDARYDTFARDLVRYDYSLQAAHYLAGARDTGVAHAKDFVFVAVEKEAPHGIALYRLCPSEHARGAAWRSVAMARYAECLRTGVWPGYPKEFQNLEAPAWAPQPVGVELPDAWW